MGVMCNLDCVGSLYMFSQSIKLVHRWEAQKVIDGCYSVAVGCGEKFIQMTVSFLKYAPDTSGLFSFILFLDRPLREAHDGIL